MSEELIEQDEVSTDVKLKKTSVKKPKKTRFVRSIINEIEEINPSIPDDIKLEAEKESLNHIYNKSVRRKKRIECIGECLYKAYENLGNPKDVIEIAKLLKCNKNDILRAINSSDDDYIIFHYPHEYIKDYLKYIDGIDVVDIEGNIKELAFKVYEKYDRILDEKPQDVAVALIMFYLQKYGFVVENKESFYSSISKSNATINRLVKIISININS